MANDDTLKALTRQAQDWDAAIIRKDIAAVAANMAPDYRHIRENGDICDGAAFLAFVATPQLVIAPYQVQDFDIRLYGDVAVVTGRTRMTGHLASTPFETHYRYTDVYVRRNGKWLVTDVQITPIPEKQER